MAKFSPTDAALEGFRIGRENPGGLIVWTLVFFAANLFSAVLMVRNGSAEILSQVAAMDPAQADPERILAAYQAATPGLLSSSPPLLLAQLLCQAAVLRVILRPDQRRAYLRFSGDELRVIGAFAAILTLALAGSFLLGQVGGLLGLPGLVLAMFASLALMVVLSVRLQLLYPQAIVERSLNLKAAWSLTRGQFWSVLGTMALATIFYVIVVMLGSVVSYAIREVGGIGAGPATSMTALMSPAVLASHFVVSLLQALGITLLSAPAAVIYRSLRGIVV